MKPFLNNGAKIELKPDPGWNWEGWDGVMEVQAVHNPVKISSRDIIHENDVPMFKLLPGRIYRATGFSDIQGLINTAVFTVDSPTLSDKIKVNGSFPLLISSTGKFTCNFTTPSFKITPGGPVPDPLPIKTGTWKVINANQKIAFRNSPSLRGFQAENIVKPAFAKISDGHAWDKHSVEFPEIKSKKEFKDLIEKVIKDPATQVKKLSHDRTAYYNNQSNIMVITNPKDPDGGTCFKTKKNGQKRFSKLL